MRQFHFLVKQPVTEHFEVTTRDKYVTIYNYSNHYVKLFKHRGTDTGNLIFTIPLYTAITIPLEIVPVITVLIEGGNDGIVKLVFSEENLGVNFTLNAPTGYSNVTVVNSLPAGSNKIGKVDVDSLPTLPQGSNKIGRVDVETLPALPEGSNLIGKVEISSFPAIRPVKVTLTAEQDYTVKSGAGKIFRISTVLNDLTIKDGTEEIWKGAGDFSNCPILCNTRIVLKSASGGDVFIQYA